MYSAARERAGAPEARRSRWIPYAFFGFFGVVLVANGIMLAFALGTFNGLSTDRPYDRGLSYNETLRDYRAQRALGWHLEVAVAEEGSASGDLAVAASDRTGAPLRGAAIVATFVRPTNEGSDLTVTLAEDAPGHYTGQAVPALAGQWTLRLDVIHPDGEYRLERRITLR